MGEMRASSSFSLHAADIFFMRHRDFGPCRFQAVSEGCGAAAGPGRERDTLVTAQPPPPAALLWEDVKA